MRQTHSYLPPPEMRTAAKASLYPAIKVLSLSNASSMPRRTSPSASGQDVIRSSGTLRFTWISKEPVTASYTRNVPQ